MSQSNPFESAPTQDADDESATPAGIDSLLKDADDAMLRTDETALMSDAVDDLANTLPSNSESPFGDESEKPNRRRKRVPRSKFESDEMRTSDADNDPSSRRRERTSPGQPASFAPQRLAKILAAAGIDARRKCEEYVTTGRVTVDGEVITDVAFRADPYSQRIELDGERVKLQRKVYFALNKPRGVVCTNHDPAGRPRVIDLFPQFKERLFSIGRLDEESEGLLLVTNDGELANRMAHPRYRVAKYYLCHVKGVPSAETLTSLKRGMYFEEGKFHVEGIRTKKVVGDSAYLEIVLNEGQNREIRRLMARVGHKVMRLKRIGFGPIRLGDLPTGAFRSLNVEELKLLKDLSDQRAYLDNTTGRRPKRGSRPRSPGNFRAVSQQGQRKPRRPIRSDREDQVIGESLHEGQRRGSSEAMKKNRRFSRHSMFNAAASEPQLELPNGEFSGGRRRIVGDELSTSDQRRPARGKRPPRRRPERGESVEQAESYGQYSNRRRSASRRPRRGSRPSDRELPARGRRQRSVRPPRRMTEDGKEILQGKVTGYRTPPKEGLGHRRRKAINGMQTMRKQRQQRRRHHEE